MKYLLKILLMIFLFIFSGCRLRLKNNYENKIYKFIELMPKAELHVHLEGSIRPHTLFKLAKRNKINLSAKTECALADIFKFKNFEHFSEVYSLVTSCLKTISDYELIAYEFGEQCASQNIKYVEATFTIYTNCKLTGLSCGEILSGLNKGRERAESEFKIKINWILDIIRDQPETQDLVLKAALNSIDKGVVGMGLSGNESKYDSAPFTSTFNKAHEKGLRITPHAGEFDIKSIFDVLNRIPVNRIGHGVQCFQDSELIAFFKDRQIPLETCLTSNICTGVFSGFKSHPLRKLWDAGLFITINSDDPALFNTDLTNEYKILFDYFNFNINDLEKISLNALKASFMPEEQKKIFIDIFKVEFLKLRRDFKI